MIPKKKVVTGHLAFASDCGVVPTGLCLEEEGPVLPPVLSPEDGQEWTQESLEGVSLVF